MTEIVRVRGGLHIMQGNHRVFGAVQDGKTVGLHIYSPEQWKDFSGLVFEVAQGTGKPKIVHGSRR